jgi:phosphoglycolate phosphatase
MNTPSISMDSLPRAGRALPKPALIVFDFDGTLVDSQAMITKVMQQAFALHGLVPPCPLAVQQVIGLSLPNAIAALLPTAARATIDALCNGYKEHYSTLRNQGLLHEPLFPGVRSVLHSLQARGFKLGIATGKSLRGLQACLAHHDLAGFFCTLQTADHHPSKPDPAMLREALAQSNVAPHDAWMVGDTHYDMHMARQCGVSALGVRWGYHAHEQLMAAGAHSVLADFADLLELTARAHEQV